MRVVVQRVTRASVTPGGTIGPGLCILLGVAEGDDETMAVRLADKVARLRIFQNDDGVLFPNQFVNVHLLVDVKHGAVIAPVAAIQRGPKGTYVYVVKGDHTVEMRPVTVGPSGRTEAAIESGLAPDETVVVEGVDKLRDGIAVQVRAPERNGTTSKPAA